ncbi:MAG: aminodeoxychorismate synthase component I [Bacteroidota bacterium]
MSLRLWSPNEAAAFLRACNSLQLHDVKHRLLNWAAEFPYICFLDNCESEIDQYGEWELLLGIGNEDAPRATSAQEMEQLQSGSWWMGGLSYDLKNHYEPILETQSEASIEFPGCALFSPTGLIGLRRDGTWMILGELPGLISAMGVVPPSFTLGSSPEFNSNFTRDQYIETVQKLREHIEAGDFYEMNLAQVFEATYRLEHPQEVFRRLVEVSPVPFAAFFRYGEKYALSASPERFLQSKDQQLLTQPIKGTAPRAASPAADKESAEALQASVKERAENVMIVDLSRNDLYRSCLPHSVEVPHLFAIQSFPQVHQMVSTITGKLRPNLSWQQVIAHTFPPGSMTGAPKVRVMEMIDRYEGCARSLYAGSIGYLSPEEEFDFNVVIRTLLYDNTTHKLSYHVGGAITYNSDPEAEYEETLLKAEAIRRALAV